MHFHASGGTTGNPSPALYSHRDIFHTTLKVAPMTNWGGIKLDDKGMNLFPAAPHLAFFQVVFTELLLGGNVFHTCGGSVIPTERQIELCERIGSDYVVAIPSYLTYWLETAVKMRAQGKIKKIDTIRHAVVAAEPMVPAYRERLRGLFAAVGSENVKIIEGYGMTELKGAFYECAEGSGIHLSPESHFWEVLDPETKEPVPEGSQGVLTFSHIDFRATVFMRYFTGDLIRGLVWDKCPHCGRTGPRLLMPMCRAVKDFTKIKGSRVNLLDLQTAIRNITGVISFQVVITKSNPDDPFSRDTVRVHVAAEEGADRDALTRDIKKNVKLDCEISPNEIVFNTMEEVEQKLFSRTNLKADWVVDERPVHL
jgi:phenylacetate-coenzyme A ligase PaaK-like adenylate-forming protein